MMKRVAAPSSLQRLLATRAPRRIVLPHRLLSSASCEVVTDDIPDYFDTLGMEVCTFARASCEQDDCCSFQFLLTLYSIAFLFSGYATTQEFLQETHVQAASRFASQ